MATEKELALLKRSALCLEDGDWDKVYELCEIVLNENPENAEAYLNKFLASRKAKTLAEAAEQTISFGGNKDYEKAIRFADKELLTELKYYSKFNAQNIKYVDAKTLMEHAMLPDAVERASKEFEELGDFKDSEQMISRCNELILKLKNRNKSFKLYAIIGIIAIFLSGIAIVLKGQAELNTTVQDFNATMASKGLKIIDRTDFDFKSKYDLNIVDADVFRKSEKENPMYSKTYTLRGRYTGYLPLVYVSNKKYIIPKNNGIIISVAATDEIVKIFGSNKDNMLYNNQFVEYEGTRLIGGFGTNCNGGNFTINCFIIEDSDSISIAKELNIGADITVTGEYLKSELISLGDRLAGYRFYVIHRFLLKKIENSKQ